MEKHPNIGAALVAAQAAAEAVEKDSRNAHQGYKYASAEAIIREARAALASAGLAFYRESAAVEWEPPVVVETRNGPKNQRTGLVRATYVLRHGDEKIVVESETPALAEAGRPEDKAVATALTYSLGYVLRDLLLLPRVEEGTDVDQRDDRERAPVRPRTQDRRTEAPQRQAARDDGEVPPEATQAVEAFAVAGDGAEIEEIAARFRPLLQSWAPAIRGIVANAKKAALARVAAAAEGAVTT